MNIYDELETAVTMLNERGCPAISISMQKRTEYKMLDQLDINFAKNVGTIMGVPVISDPRVPNDYVTISYKDQGERLVWKIWVGEVESNHKSSDPL